MKLYFNGCSHTWGEDLLDPSTQSWPALTANSLGCDFVNDSVSGGTNDRIMYRTIKQIDQFDKFYIAWTYTSRFTRYRNNNNHEINFNAQLKNSLYEQDPEFKNYSLIHYRTWHNELYSFKIWLQNIILLQSLFELRNKSYLMLNATDNLIDRWTTDWSNFNNSVKSLLCFDLINDEQLQTEHFEIQNLLRQINFSKFVDWNKWWLTSLIGQYPVGPTGHLLEEGHRVSSQHILNYDSN